MADCIASAWRQAPRSGVEVPVTVTAQPDHLFVGVGLPAIPELDASGARHPLNSVRAEVSAVPGGSHTV